MFLIFVFECDIIQFKISSDYDFSGLNVIFLMLVVKFICIFLFKLWNSTSFFLQTKNNNCFKSGSNLKQCHKILYTFKVHLV